MELQEQRVDEIHRNGKARTEEGIAAAIADLVDLFPLGIVLITGNGEVLHVNAAARMRLQGDGALSIAGDVVRFSDDEDDRLFHLAAERAAFDRDGEAHFLRVAADSRLLFCLRRLREDFGGSPILALLVADPTSPLDVRDDHLATVYNLTRSEARVARQLVLGNTPTQIAALSCVSVHTVRTHLRNIFEKTGAKGQSDLVRLVAAVPLFLVSGRILGRGSETL